MPSQESTLAPLHYLWIWDPIGTQLTGDQDKGHGFKHVRHGFPDCEDEEQEESQPGRLELVPRVARQEHEKNQKPDSGKPWLLGAVWKPTVPLTKV